MEGICYRPRWYQRIILRMAASRIGSAVLSRILRPFDNAVLALTGHRHTLTQVVTGLPVIELTTWGSRSGLPRTCPLLAIPVESGFAVLATNFGARKHPSWYYNLSANPSVDVRMTGGYQEKRIARLINGEAKESIWRQAIALYPGYREYRKWTGGREVPVFILEIPD